MTELRNMLKDLILQDIRKNVEILDMTFRNDKKKINLNRRKNRISENLDIDIRELLEEVDTLEQGCMKTAGYLKFVSVMEKLDDSKIKRTGAEFRNKFTEILQRTNF